MFNAVKKKFEEYLKVFNLDQPKIREKYEHTLRVLVYAKKIAKSIKLNTHNLELVLIAALVHDIGRFLQAARYNTFLDRKTFDHGDMGEIMLLYSDILSPLTEEDKTVILKAVRNHNKNEIEEGLTKKEMLITKVLRDADKLDIMAKQFVNQSIPEEEVDPKILMSFRENKTVDSKFVKTFLDDVLKQISFVFDANFPYTVSIMLGFIKLRFAYLRESCVNIKELEQIVKDYIREKKYVR